MLYKQAGSRKNIGMELFDVVHLENLQLCIQALIGKFANKEGPSWQGETFFFFIVSFFKHNFMLII